MVKNALNIISISVILGFASLLFSYREVIPTPEDSSATFASGGFPIRAFEYPFPALGSNEIPLRMLLLYGVDILFWVAIILILSMVIPQVKNVITKYHVVLIPLGTIALSVTYLYLMIRFD